MLKILSSTVLLLIANIGFCANQGKISNLLFSSSDSEWGASHSDIVQFSLEQDYSSGTCNQTFAAVKKSDEHLVSVVLAAYMANKSIRVVLSNSRYFSDRCIISDIFIDP